MDDHSDIPEQRRPPVEERARPDPVHWVDVLAELHEWATPALTAGPDVPVFGSPAWCALAEEDPAKAFAVGRAALAWWTDQIRGAEQQANEHVETSHAISRAEDWSKIALEPNHAELARRRRRDRD